MEEVAIIVNYIVPAIVAYLVWVHRKVTSHDVSIATSDKSHQYNSKEFDKINEKLEELINTVHRLEIKITGNGQGDI